MRRTIPLISLAIMLFACTNEVEIQLVEEKAPTFKAEQFSDDYAIQFNAEDLDKNYFVTDRDIEAYLKFKSLNEEKAVDLKEISPFVFEGATLFYTINYQTGWEIISADKRTPYLLAKGESGEFSMKDYETTPWGTWMFSVGLDVLKTRLYGTNVSFDENENFRFWTLLTDPEKLLGKPSELLAHPPLLPDGYYELKSVYTEQVVDSVSHLIWTKWSQSENDCNYYVPYRTDNSSLKAPAGCVAVAGAQMLYYLHGKIGAPSAIPDYAYCTGNINNYQMGQTGSSTTVWSQMSKYGNTYAAILIANAGSCVGMSYGNDGSGADTEDLVDNFFGVYGIDCTYRNYSTNAIRSEIIDRNIPIIVRAGSFVLFDTWNNAHSFIIDGAKYIENRTTYSYEWVYNVDPDPNVIIPAPPRPYSNVIYSFNSLDLIQMNWGWSGSHDAEWYSPGGDWVVNMDGRYNFQYRRKMISGFSVN